jgi:hypothetical protein
MLDKAFNQLVQKGTSLLETSMVLMLSASVIVCRVLSLFRTTEDGFKIDELSRQIIHMVSEINGVYASSKDKDVAGTYAGLNNHILLSLLPELQESKIQAAGSPFIDTSFPFLALTVSAVYYDKARNIIIDQGIPSNSFAISLLSTDNMNMQEVCLHFLALGYGGQVVGYAIGSQDSAAGIQFNDFLDATNSFSNRIKMCNYFRGKKARLSVIFK